MFSPTAANDVIEEALMILSVGLAESLGGLLVVVGGLIALGVVFRLALRRIHPYDL